MARINTDDDTSLLEVACGGRTWKVNTCAGHADDAGDGTAMCVDCSDPCGEGRPVYRLQCVVLRRGAMQSRRLHSYMNDNGLPDNDKAAMMSVYFQDKYPPPGIVEMEAEAEARPARPSTSP